MPSHPRISAGATLHLLCGKIASGKSTLATKLAMAPGTIVLSEDQWLAQLYSGEILSISDYVRRSAQLRRAIGPHVVELLRLGMSVILDFPANTAANRLWMRNLFEQANAAHCLHLLDVPDDLCKERLHARNASGKHDFAATDTEFDLITSHFEPPSPGEKFDVIRHGDPAIGGGTLP
ncbi:ATP-binding protein [Telmatospirillum sp.]|uniref:AAA family ATPase n=1 Tax=Telmatospirillum sp. TaxID=2079197 RepID=UPI00283AF6C9|nr:ATP-binding protein [Telmatospirillum sp.]MDR3439428.1 ATP-binding protein [Telmatospirillum sp.]